MAPDAEEVDAGAFSPWLSGAVRAVLDGAASDVPCGACTACCESSQFVHIEPDEIEALAHVPAELLAPAPGLPRGHMLLGYDEHGRCPMLVDGGCSIYEHRPRTCRTYDCRIFPAAGVEPDPAQPAIAARAARWRFDHPTEADQAAHGSVRRAAAFLATHPEVVDSPDSPRHPTRLAVQAIALHDLFRGPDDPDVGWVSVEVRRRRGRPAPAK